MPFVREDIYAALQSAQDSAELKALLTFSTAQLGFKHCCYGLRLPLPVSRRPVHMIDAYPSGWMPHYEDAGYIETDPVVKLGMRSALPIVWTDGLFSEADTLWREARDFGIRIGVSQSSWAAQGTFGILSLARDTEPLGAKEMAKLAEPLCWLGNMTHLVMRRLFASGLQEDIAVNLTQREQDVLRWTGEGKTASEIGQILAISPRTVNFHLENTVVKLASRNRVQAVVKAFALGLIC